MQTRGKSAQVHKFFLLVGAVVFASLMTGFFHAKDFEEVTFPNTDSVEIQGTLYRPKGDPHSILYPQILRASVGSLPLWVCAQAT